MQLSLMLGDSRRPWGGRSPRDLTRAAELFRLAPEGTGRSIEAQVNVAQLELFPQESPHGSK